MEIFMIVVLRMKKKKKIRTVPAHKTSVEICFSKLNIKGSLFLLTVSLSKAAKPLIAN